MKAQLILELEKEIDCIFKVVDLKNINLCNSGKTSEYSTDENGNITGITIYTFELKEIPETISKCKTLSKLNFKKNQISDISSLKELTRLKTLN